MTKSAVSTLGALRKAVASGEIPHRTVREEVRDNLIRKLRAGEMLFPGIIGYEDSVVPQLINALLSQHNFILLGLRGQAKTRLLRALTTLLDDEIPVVPGCEINDDPLAPLCGSCRARVASEGDQMPISWLPREFRYVEKLATPDVTIADMVGDIDPIKAARSGLQLSSEFTMHYGLLPRANRGIFAINELPDLAGKIQVGLFNILQEGDVQIKGYPIRLPLDVLMAYGWPGNVRELQNVIERAVALADGTVVEVKDVPLDLMLPDVEHLVDDPTSLPLREARERFDRQVILRVLERVRWNQSEAARLLGLHRNSLKTKLLAWGIDPVALASAGGRGDAGGAQ